MIGRCAAVVFVIVLLVGSGCGLINGIGNVEHPLYPLSCWVEAESCGCTSGTQDQASNPFATCGPELLDGDDVLCCALPGYPGYTGLEGCSCRVVGCASNGFDDGDCTCRAGQEPELSSCKGAFCCREKFGPCSCSDANDGCDGERVDSCTPADVGCGDDEDEFSACRD